MAFVKMTNSDKMFLIDDEDLELINSRNWYLSLGYVISSKVRLQRLLTNCPKGYVVDHINGNKLDNRKVNLRVCKQKENCMNLSKRKNSSSEFKGVKNISKNKWSVSIQKENNQRYIGTFSNEIAAANAYNLEAKKEFGEFARINEVEFMSKEEVYNFLIKRKQAKIKSKYKGVNFQENMNKFRARVTIDGKRITLGYSDSEEECNDMIINFKKGFLQ